MGKGKLDALLSLSSWCLLTVVWLFLAVPWICLQFVTVIFADHTHLLFLCKCCSNKPLVQLKVQALFYVVCILLMPVQCLLTLQSVV